MAVVEKRVPQYLSIGAMVASVLAVAWLWQAGMQNPRRYVSDMYINKHQGYELVVGCNGCHVPVGGTFSMLAELNCTSAACHGELHGDTTPDRRLELAMELFQYRPEGEKKADVYLKIHWGYIQKGYDCWSCHKEHSIGESHGGGDHAGTATSEGLLNLLAGATPDRHSEFQSLIHGAPDAGDI